MNCIKCGKEFFGRKKKYCTDCGKYTPVRVEKTCSVCGRVFLGKTNNSFCSEVCKHSRRNEVARRRYVPVEQGKATCSMCGCVLSGRIGRRMCEDCKRSEARKRGLERYHKNAKELNRKSYLVKREKPEYWEKHKKNKQVRRAREKELPADLTVLQWIEAVAFFKGCAYCGKMESLHQDHFIPLALGGGYTKGNIVPACRECNSRKGDRHPSVWLKDRPDVYKTIVGYLEKYF